MSRKRAYAVDRPLTVVGGRQPRPPTIKLPSAHREEYHLQELRHHTLWGRGPEHLRLYQEPARAGGPGEPPPGFVVATTSRVEWDIWYWLWIIEGVEGDPRNSPSWQNPPPGPNGSFTYQVNFLGGRHKAQGAVPDFLVQRSPFGNRVLLLRLQGEWQHVFTHSVKIETDLFQKFRLTAGDIQVIDLYEQHFLSGPNARRGTMPQVLIDALQGIAWTGPIASGNPFRMHVSV